MVGDSDKVLIFGKGDVVRHAGIVRTVADKVNGHIALHPNSNLTKIHRSLDKVSEQYDRICELVRIRDTAVNVTALFEGLTLVLSALGENAILVEKELMTLSSHFTKVAGDLKSQKDHMQYGDWLAAHFDLIGANHNIVTLRIERRMNKPPTHWGCPAHLGLLRKLKPLKIDTVAFDAIWDMKHSRDFLAHGEKQIGSPYVTVENFAALYPKDFQDVDSTSFNDTQKKALKGALHHVNQTFLGRVQGKAKGGARLPRGLAWVIKGVGWVGGLAMVSKFFA